MSLKERLIARERVTNLVPSKWYIENLYGDYIFLCGADTQEDAQAYATRNWGDIQVNSSLIAHRRNHGN